MLRRHFTKLFYLLCVCALTFCGQIKEAPPSSNDDDFDGILNSVECVDQSRCPDTDGDGLANYQDSDSDNDGILDKDECPDPSACVDTDLAGLPDYLDDDSDADGILDQFECPTGAPCIDTDRDGKPNYQDSDSDNDGKSDLEECLYGHPCPDDNGNGLLDYIDSFYIDEPDLRPVSFTVFGLRNDQSVQLRLNNRYDKTVFGSGEYSFDQKLEITSVYVVDVIEDSFPEGMNCSVTGDLSGAIGLDGTHSVHIECLIDKVSIDESLKTGEGHGKDIDNAAPSCHWIKLFFPESPSGVYFLDVDGPDGSYQSFRAYCDMETLGGGWTLVNKSKYTETLPSKVALTGDIDLTEAFRINPLRQDTWSSVSIDPRLSNKDNFIQTQVPHLYAPGYLTQSLLEPFDTFNNFGNDTNYSIMDRKVIDILRSNLYAGDRSKSIIMQLSGVQKFHIKSSKKFNPIEHRCKNIDDIENNAQSCNESDRSACSENYIFADEIYSSYNPYIHDTPETTSFAFDTYNSGRINPITINETCQFQSIGPDNNRFGLNLGWGGFSHTSDLGVSSFYNLYQLSENGTVHSGPISNKATLSEHTSHKYWYCTSELDCPLSTVWVK